MKNKQSQCRMYEEHPLKYQCIHGKECDCCPYHDALKELKELRSKILMSEKNLDDIFDDR